MPSWTGAGGSTWRSIPARPHLKKSAWWGGATTFPSTTRRRPIAWGRGKRLLPAGGPAWTWARATCGWKRTTPRRIPFCPSGSSHPRPMSQATFPRLVGLEPWLPWPLSASPAWTVPVRAERLAILRIGVALVLLWDISCSYLPNHDVFYGEGSLGAPRLMHDAGRSPAWAWSILRGVGDPLTSHLALVVLLVSSTLIVMGLWSYLHHPQDQKARAPLRIPLLLWAVSAVIWTMGVWARLTPPEE